jgi:hypothetical protein
MNQSSAPVAREYFRRDNKRGVSAPDLSKECTFAEHIVHARGKRTQFTSVSLDLSKIRDFGDTDYRLIQDRLVADRHTLVEHESLVESLREAVRGEEKAERLRAAQALRYATRRKEGLVTWAFDISGVARKGLITWAEKKVQVYFARVN